MQAQTLFKEPPLSDQAQFKIDILVAQRALSALSAAPLDLFAGPS